MIYLFCPHPYVMETVKYVYLLFHLSLINCLLHRIACFSSCSFCLWMFHFWVKAKCWYMAFMLSQKSLLVVLSLLIPFTADIFWFLFLFLFYFQSVEVGASFSFLFHGFLVACLLAVCLFLLFFSLSSHCNYLLEFISWWCVESVQTLYLTICKYLRQQPSTTDKLPVNKRRNEDILSQSFHHIASNSAIANSYSSLWLWDKLLTQPLSFQLFTLFFFLCNSLCHFIFLHFCVCACLYMVHVL